MSQQIYLPLSGRYPIPYEFEADTMPVPRGHSSVLWELRDGNLTAAEAMIYLFLNHGSTWNSRSNVVYVREVFIGAAQSRHVAKLCAKDRSEPQ